MSSHTSHFAGEGVPTNLWVTYGRQAVTSSPKTCCFSIVHRGLNNEGHDYPTSTIHHPREQASPRAHEHHWIPGNNGIYNSIGKVPTGRSNAEKIEFMWSDKSKHESMIGLSACSECVFSNIKFFQGFHFTLWFCFVQENKHFPGWPNLFVGYHKVSAKIARLCRDRALMFSLPTSL